MRTSTHQSPELLCGPAADGPHSEPPPMTRSVQYYVRFIPQQQLSSCDVLLFLLISLYLQEQADSSRTRFSPNYWTHTFQNLWQWQPVERMNIQRKRKGRKTLPACLDSSRQRQGVRKQRGLWEMWSFQMYVCGPHAASWTGNQFQIRPNSFTCMWVRESQWLQLLKELLYSFHAGSQSLGCRMELSHSLVGWF